MSEPGLPNTIANLQHQARAILKQAGIETAALEARVILCHVCQIAEAEVIAYPEQEIEQKQAREYLYLVARRARRIPLAHLLGVREFWGLEFCVNDQTLIPRPETEFAVELGIQFARNICEQAGHARILDLGCGTGCMLISILHEVKDASGVGVDINPRAVELSRKNAQKLEVDTRATFHCMNWGDGLKETFDIIVSNPPYIASGELEGLMPEVARYEPARALDGGTDGLDEYRKIIPQARHLLHRRGRLILEIGDGQANDVLDLLEQNGLRPHNISEPVKYDLCCRERIIGAVKVC